MRGSATIEFVTLGLLTMAGLFALVASPADRTLISPASQVEHSAPALPQTGPLPEWLSETGLFLIGTLEIDPRNHPYSPQYALWSDGAVKRRWLYLPPGSAIDGSQSDAWEFPPGTRLWKEFSHGEAVETRMIERLADGSWRFAAYVWNESHTDARLVPAEGLPRHPAAHAPGGRYDIPSREDCLACHEGPAVPVLGVSALQLSTDRDPSAPNSEPLRPGDLDLPLLVELGLLINLPEQIVATPPRIAVASGTSRAALGYLHANCGHCHNAAGSLALLELELDQNPEKRAEAVLQTLIGRPSEFSHAGINTRVVPGLPDVSLLALRMQSRNPLVQMPPLGTVLPDPAGMELINRWIQQDLTFQQEKTP